MGQSSRLQPLRVAWSARVSLELQSVKSHVTLEVPSYPICMLSHMLVTLPTHIYGNTVIAQRPCAHFKIWNTGSKTDIIGNHNNTKIILKSTTWSKLNILLRTKLHCIPSKLREQAYATLQHIGLFKPLQWQITDRKQRILNKFMQLNTHMN